MDVSGIVREWLKEHGYSGLFNGGLECGCTFDDFMACGEVHPECEPGHKWNYRPDTCPKSDEDGVRETCSICAEYGSPNGDDRCCVCAEKQPAAREV